MEMLRFKPLYKERVWGGQNLASRLGRQLPKGQCIGESWDIVDSDSEQSIVLEGPFKGHTLNHLLQSHPEAIMGPRFPKGSPFPILVKWLDCKETLSVQVQSLEFESKACLPRWFLHCRCAWAWAWIH